jgi:8-oxo-dGTP diphosphatase
MADRACVAILDGTRLLMVRQTYRGATFWTLPGGSIEPGETPEQAAIREVREEVCLEVQIVRLLCRVPRTSGTGLYSCFLGRIVSGEVRLGHDPELAADAGELHEVRWIGLDELREHPEVTRIRDALSVYSGIS